MARLSGIQRIMEVGMIVCSMFALYLLLALASFDPADPSWSQAGFREDVQNAAGPIGAWFADILLNSFGYIAYAFPFGIALLGWFLFQQTKDLLELDYLTIGLRLIGGILSIIGATALFSLNADDVYVFSAGGFVGDAISGRLLPYFNLAGTTLLLLCFLCTGLTLMTGLSWLALVDHIGDWAISGLRWLGRLPAMLQDMQVPSLPKRTKATAPEPEDIAESPMASRQEPVVEPVSRREPVIEPVFTMDDEPSFDDVAFFDEPEPVRAAPTPAPVVKPKPAKDKPKTLAELEEEYAVEGERPSFNLLDRPDKVKNPISPEELEAASRLVEAKLLDFNIEAKVVGVYPGPVITRFELDLAPGVKVAKISSLSKDLARALSAISVRVVEVIPGKSVIGLELPNKHREMVRLSEVIECDVFQNSASNLTMVLGKDIAGKPVVVDLAKMPHLLVAGTTGSGKSVGVNVMILSLLYKSSPEDVRLIMIDPKMLELSVYEGIPHLLAEVVTDMKEAANALRWCVGEMERRYRLMSALGVRNLKGYNAKIADAIEAGEPIKDPLWKPEQSMDPEAPDLEKLPSIVVVVDEFADMMMIVGKKVEELIARIAQKARAAGIHLVLATQRPSVDVITGLIKANIPTRIAFQVSSKIDSRTILDQQGAEALLGQGDMLYLPPGTGVPTRVHGAFVDDHEVHAVVADWQKRGKPNYIDEILSGEGSAEVLLPGEQAEGDDAESDPLYDEAVAFVTQSRRASVSSVQRQFRIGYNRAARIVEQMEMCGVVSAQGHNGNREVLAPPPV
ncbi:DNA translocase FtsK 4TM domain-containing protein [Bowmanella sp. Y26]|uniref:DNA translocase FtsK n=1 Tax=Bowmanella yangjiangensis TaxID=2811230 RepID=UPI001BDBF30A|nr:DNA translocase FtsK 4TM domain-containing protein [Bowmanella yangjiangensis]MBT1065011.1 DNA translocase FtsK 4TM domain-containing protein [Bowmanella yangjiangensis]